MSYQAESGEEFDVIATENRGIIDRASSGARNRPAGGTVVIDVKSQEMPLKK